jgi:hypothetical protein
MRGFLKMTALSAVLSFTLVTAYNQALSSQPDGGGKIYHDRLSADDEAAVRASSPVVAAAFPSATTARKGDRLAPQTACGEQTWPYIAPSCMSASGNGATPKPVRVITIEAHEGVNTSVLNRVPQADVASR